MLFRTFLNVVAHKVHYHGHKKRNKFHLYKLLLILISIVSSLKICDIFDLNFPRFLLNSFEGL